MKKVFWIFACFALSVSVVFGQDDNYYQDNNHGNPNPYNYNLSNNGYNNNTAPAPAPADPGYNANVNVTVTPDPNYSNNAGAAVNQDYNNNTGGAAIAPDPNYNASTGSNTASANVSIPDGQMNNSVNNDNNANYQNFHDQLSPYGTWMNYPGYGNVWIPNQVPSGFSPYVSGGHWLYTDAGWTWVSDYAWGGVPFHYGRWFRDNAYGWMWMPGYQWAPAWVSWGSYGNYYCWAPLAPFASYYGYRPVYGWNFCAREHFCEGNLSFYLANRSFYGRGDFRSISAHINMMNETRAFGNRSYLAGPRVGEVERATGHSIATAHLSSTNRGMANHSNGNQFHQPANTGHQNFENHSPAYAHQGNMQSNHYANNNMQRSQSYNRGNANMNRSNFGDRSQRSFGQNQSMAQGNMQSSRQAPQHYSRPSSQSYRGAQQRSYQPMHSQSERSFASAQRSSSSHGSSRSGSGSHGSRR